MVYEFIGKLTLTILILISIPVFWVIGYIFLEKISELIEKLPEKLQAGIVITILGMIVIGFGWFVYNSL
jgi:hypothetical protein